MSDQPPASPTEPARSTAKAGWSARAAQAGFRWGRSALWKVDPERAHLGTLRLLEHLPPARRVLTTPRLETTVCGVRFANPVGLAPGFDKDARVPHVMPRFGFGAVELGTLTPLAQPGNPRPRLFRLTQDGAVINRMGFNNAGQDAALERLQRMRTGGLLAVPVGINVGANKDSVDRIADYVTGVRAMAPVADYLTVNISSPNTPGLRALQDAGALDALLGAVMDTHRDATKGMARPVPVWLKVAPDLTDDDIRDIVRIVMQHKVHGLIVSNTTIDRPATLTDAAKGEAGGLSGAPLRDKAHAALIAVRRASGGQLPLIGVGGIASAADAYARIRAGASLVQLYSALVFQGPALAATIVEGLDTSLQRDGFARVTDAVGVDVSI